MSSRGTWLRGGRWCWLLSAVALAACGAGNDGGSAVVVAPPDATGAPFGPAGGPASSFPGQAGMPGVGAGPSMTGAAGGSGISGAAGSAGIGIGGRGGASGIGAAGGRGGTGGASGGGGAGGLAGIGGAGVGGASGAGGAGGNPETGRLAGITAAHNAVRAMVQSATPLPPVTWSPTLAAYAQQWADNEAMTACNNPQHRSGQELQQKGYGENLAVFGSSGGSGMSTAQKAVSGWAAEVSCYTFGTILGTEQCNVSCYTNMHSDGCGHYTQIVWRKTTQIGCGVASCQSGGLTSDIWICNYSPPGNVVGQSPY